jgi:hypothetical protein
MNEDDLTYGQCIEKHLPEWAIKTKEIVSIACEEAFMLSLEVDRLRSNEEIHEKTNELFSEWTDEFFTINGLAHLIEPYHDFLSDKMDEEDEDE